MKMVFTGTRIGLLLALALASGCGQGAQRIDSSQRITTVHQIDIQDWTEMADQMLDSLYASGRLEQAPRQPAVVAVSRIVNDTTNRINTALLTDRVLASLNATGKANASVVVGHGGADDPLQEQQQNLEQFLGQRPTQVRQFDYTLSGRIIEQRARAGRVQQSTFVFTLRLADTRTSTAVWQDTREIDKAGTRAAVGL